MNHGEHGEHGEILHRELSDRVLDCAFSVHRALGPGLLESAYEACLTYELRKRGMHVERQKELSVIYEEVMIECGFRADLIVENSIIVELKTVGQMAPIHHAQLMTYLRLTGLRLGLLINFNVKLLKDGIKRIAL